MRFIRLVQGLCVLASAALLLVCMAAYADDGRGPPKGAPGGDGPEPPWVRNRRDAKDRAGGLPKAILDQQRIGKVEVPSLEAAGRLALAAARKVADGVIDRGWHTGRRLQVPKDHATIQAAIDAARPRDVVVVSAGTYHELLVMKDGVKLVSDHANGGDEFVAVEGAGLRLPRRALRTIIDGSKSTPSSHGLIDFQPGTSRHAIVDGFTLQKLPHQNHHRPGHAHGLNVRGASPVIMLCLLQDNGSTGIGNHVVYRDQSQPLAARDFRHANIAHRAEAVLYGNIVRRNLGRGIGCNHFSAPLILGNEVYANDDAALGEGTGPGIGMKHGAAPLVLGNLVHDNPGGGIVCKAGAPQGAHPIDRPTAPAFECNVAWKNGAERPCIGASKAGSRSTPLRIVGNWVFDSNSVGIGLSEGSWAIVERNLVARSARPGISIYGATVLRLDANRVTQVKDAGIVIVQGAHVLQMRDNVADAVDGPRFVLRDAHVGPRSRAGEAGPPKIPPRPRVIVRRDGVELLRFRGDDVVLAGAIVGRFEALRVRREGSVVGEIRGRSFRHEGSEAWLLDKGNLYPGAEVRRQGAILGDVRKDGTIWREGARWGSVKPYGGSDAEALRLFVALYYWSDFFKGM